MAYRFVGDIEYDATSDEERVGDGGVKFTGHGVREDADILARLRGEDCLRSESPQSTDESRGESGRHPDIPGCKNGESDDAYAEQEKKDLDGSLAMSKREPAGTTTYASGPPKREPAGTTTYASGLPYVFAETETVRARLDGTTSKQKKFVEEGATEKIEPTRQQGQWYKKAEEISTTAKDTPIQQEAKTKRRRQRKRPLSAHTVLATNLTSALPHFTDNNPHFTSVQRGQQQKTRSARHSTYLGLNPAAGAGAKGSGTLSPTAQPFIPKTVAKVPATAHQSKSLVKSQPIVQTQPRRHRYRSTLQSEKDKFTRAIKQWSHMGINKSPFMPQTLNEWLEVKAATAADKKKLAEKKLATKEAERLVGIKINPCMGGKTFDFPGTPVLGLQSIWNADQADERSHADWPTALEMKFEGDDRAKSGFGRFLPLPRGKEFDKRLLEGTATVTWDGVGRVPWGERKLMVVEELDRVWGSEGLDVDGERIYGKAWEIDDEEGEMLLGKDLMRCLDMDDDEAKANAGGK